ncbi:diacylglycerol kinase (ATP) [Sphingomonas leidyi]|uniref:Diacylglycerol kinase (ATP) n=1 Tax=Sphingomonas leidyi TaxID=68569 RepID=A0A7X5UXW1_9SPHN|nr:diacylglycerol kinase [Sphingomonas leidyi]NIJ63751.1 diacylglycerol kinase (ATP) [Sphingomonas leidyi]
MKGRPFRARMGFALAGIRAGWAREASFRSQARLAAMALLALLLLRPAPVWWALVAVCCAIVLALELVNSAMEAVIDLLHPGVHPSIKAAKDMLAGAVLVMSAAALAVAVAMVAASGPHFLEEIGL